MEKSWIKELELTDREIHDVERGQTWGSIEESRDIAQAQLVKTLLGVQEWLEIRANECMNIPIGRMELDLAAYDLAQELKAASIEKSSRC